MALSHIHLAVCPKLKNNICENRSSGNRVTDGHPVLNCGSWGTHQAGLVQVEFSNLIQDFDKSFCQRNDMLQSAMLHDDKN